MTPALSRSAVRPWDDAPLLTGLTVLMMLAGLPLLVALGLDPRQFQGESVWIKPLKFHAALVIYAATLALYARWLPEGLAARRAWRLYLGVVAAAILAELVLIGGAAALGTASHFNLSSPIWARLYTLMGVAAVTLTSLSLAFGIAIARNRATGLPAAVRDGLVLGLILTFVLTLVTAGTMSAGAGHHVGLAVTGDRLALMGWSREVGDLRVAHFFATHALHGLPLAALAALALPDGWRRPAVWGAAAVYAGFVLAVFVQALAGRPFL
jgi:hypothetical protein